MAMTASKGPFEGSEADVVDDSRPAAPRRSVAVDVAWTLDPAIILVFERAMKARRVASVSDRQSLRLVKKTNFETANGNSKLPGTVCMTMFFSRTPFSFKVETVPSTRASMTVLFHRAWTMPIRSFDPSKTSFVGSRPLTVASRDIVKIGKVMDKGKGWDGGSLGV